MKRFLLFGSFSAGLLLVGWAAAVTPTTPAAKKAGGSLPPAAASDVEQRLLQCVKVSETFESLSTFADGQEWIRKVNEEVQKFNHQQTVSS